jgi:hypothetical protein
MAALRNKDGVVIGACDSLSFGEAFGPKFDRIGRRPWGPWSDVAAADRARAAAADRARQAIAADIEIDTSPSMQDALGDWYKRLP